LHGAILNLSRNLVVLFLLFVCGLSARADDLGALNESFWQWRAQEQPFTNDDIPRIESPDAFVVDWSAKTISERLQQLNSFEWRWQHLVPSVGASPHARWTTVFLARPSLQRFAAIE
jgi:hypothetical protein